MSIQMYNYKNKEVLITGGGGSIGLELCIQNSKMSPKQLKPTCLVKKTAVDLCEE